MIEPEDYQANLAAAVAMFQALGPFLVRLDVSPVQYANLRRRVTPERRPDLAGKLAAVDVHVVEDLVPGAVRLHWSDGRVVTRYRLVRDPRVLQLTFSADVYGGRRGQAAKRHYLTLCIRRWGWVHATDAWGASATHEWAGQRVSPYVPGLARLAELAGLELTDWQRDYVARAVKAPFTGHHLHVVYPRHYGRGLPPDTSS